jgi:hypothetical protein
MSYHDLSIIIMIYIYLIYIYITILIYDRLSSPSILMYRIFLFLLHHCAGAAFGENVILMSGGQDTTVQARGLLPAPPPHANLSASAPRKQQINCMII